MVVNVNQDGGRKVQATAKDGGVEKGRVCQEPEPNGRSQSGMYGSSRVYSGVKPTRMLLLSRTRGGN